MLAVRAAGKPASIEAATICAAVPALALVLLIFTTPSLDTFGHVGEWGPAWLDALTGARATIAPRAVAPLALLLLLLSAVLDYQLGTDDVSANN